VTIGHIRSDAIISFEPSHLRPEAVDIATLETPSFTVSYLWYSCSNVQPNWIFEIHMTHGKQYNKKTLLNAQIHGADYCNCHTSLRCVP